MNGFGTIKGYEDWKKLKPDERDFYIFMAIDRQSSRVGRIEKIVFGGMTIVLVAFLTSLTGIWT